MDPHQCQPWATHCQPSTQGPQGHRWPPPYMSRGGAGCPEPSPRERGTTRRTSFRGTTFRNAGRERVGVEHGTPAEHVPAGRPRRPRSSTEPLQDLDRAAMGTRLHPRARNGRPSGAFPSGQDEGGEQHSRRSAPINLHRFLVQEGGSCVLVLNWQNHGFLILFSGT
jgi:hypothetical protein